MKPDIVIERIGNGFSGGFNVVFGDKSTGLLTFGEMLDVVACLTVPAARRSLEWLKTKEQHQVDEARQSRVVAAIEAKRKSTDALKTIKKYCSKELPPGWTISIYVDSIGVKCELMDEEGDAYNFEPKDDDPIKEACDYAQQQTKLDNNESV